MDDHPVIAPVGAQTSVDRRQVSVLFTDMVGYTAIVDRLGEEKALAFTQDIYRRMTDTVVNHGGTVRGFAGDSIMALFGIPDAQEDAALRACRAALALQDSFAQAADDFERRFQVRPGLRVGICSGVAVMAAVQGENSPLTAVGSTVNLASRIQALAPEGGCLICESTYKLVRWVTDLDDGGQHTVKGLDTPQSLWNLKGVHAAADRFDASIARGLSEFVGRSNEMGVLTSSLEEAGESSRWVDLVAEAGLGKTRLIFEFLRLSKSSSTLILMGHCPTNGGRTPFLPFIEIVRRMFNLRDGEDRGTTIERLEAGLRDAGLASPEALSLLLNLLGRAPLDGALEGLDGVLVGLRTRDLISALVAFAPEDMTTILLIEDIHWIDEASEDLLRKLYEMAPEGLLIVTTRRPHYTPGWLSGEKITTLALPPLTSEAIGVIAQSRLGVDALPEDLADRLMERAGGNPLFGEELLNFLLEEGALRTEAGVAEYDEPLARDGLPASMQSLITARVEQLAPSERSVLQAAAVMGRRFEANLLALVVEPSTTLDESLRNLMAHDIVRTVGKEDAYIFRHSLIRETLYANMVSDRRERLHLAIARAIEDRHADGLHDVSDALAYHYGETEDAALAFKYNAMAGARSARIFSLREAERYLDSAFCIYEREPEVVTDESFAAFAADYALCASLSLRAKDLISREPVFRDVLERIGPTREHALFLHHLSSCLVCAGRYVEARDVQDRLTQMAQELGDPVARGYALVTELAIPNYTHPLPTMTFDALVEEADTLIPALDDAYLENFYPSQVLWRHITQGLVGRADATVVAMLEAGQRRNDPRVSGYGLSQRALIAMLGGNYERALELSDQALREAKTEWDRASATSSRLSARVALRQEGAMEDAEAYIELCRQKGWRLYMSGPDSIYGLGLAIDGRIGAGLRHIEAAITRREAEGYEPAAYWSRLYLCEIYLAVLSGEGDASVGTLLRNAGTLLPILIKGRKRIRELVSEIRACPHFDPEGYYTSHCELILGLVEKPRNPEAAKHHLLEARRIVEPWGDSPMLARIDAALAG